MTFVQLKYILTIAETKSLNKAAEQLYVSQPSLTNALKELEKEVGITIFFSYRAWCHIDKRWCGIFDVCP